MFVMTPSKDIRHAHDLGPRSRPGALLLRLLRACELLVPASLHAVPDDANCARPFLLLLLTFTAGHMVFRVSPLLRHRNKFALQVSLRILAGFGSRLLGPLLEFPPLLSFCFVLCPLHETALLNLPLTMLARGLLQVF